MVVQDEPHVCRERTWRLEYAHAGVCAPAGLTGCESLRLAVGFEPLEPRPALVCEPDLRFRCSHCVILQHVRRRASSPFILLGAVEQGLTSMSDTMWAYVKDMTFLLLLLQC